MGGPMAEKTILITGCSSGIGHHAAMRLRGRGWRVFATCRKEADVAALTEQGFESWRIDYQDPESIAAGWDETMERLSERSGGRLDALFNNGAFAQPGAVEDLPVDALRASFEANFFGWHDLTRRAIPLMRRQGAGRILQNSSVLGFAALRMRGAYISTKFALEGLSDTMRLELAGTGVEVILLEPGPIRTRIRENARAHFERWIDKDKSAWAEFYRTTLMPRLYSEAPEPDAFELGCEATTRKIIHALESRRPRARYYVTTPTYVVGTLKRLLPTRLLDRVLIRG